VKKGMRRPEAFKLVRSIAIDSNTHGKRFNDLVSKNARTGKLLSQDELRTVLDPKHYLGKAKDLTQGAVRKTKEERSARGLT
jgi:adenylosuccinate lyase